MARVLGSGTVTVATSARIESTALATGSRSDGDGLERDRIGAGPDRERTTAVVRVGVRDVRIGRVVGRACVGHRSVAEEGVGIVVVHSELITDDVGVGHLDGDGNGRREGEGASMLSEPTPLYQLKVSHPPPTTRAGSVPDEPRVPFRSALLVEANPTTSKAQAAKLKKPFIVLRMNMSSSIPDETAWN